MRVQRTVTVILKATKWTKTSDGATIGVILSYAGKDARELYKTLSWKEEGDEKKFKICYMSDRDSDW